MIVVAGDTLLIPDIGNMRMNWISPDAGVVRTESLIGRITPRTRHVVGLLPGGGIVMFSNYVQRGEAGRVTRPLSPVVLLPPRLPARVVAQLPDFETVLFQTRYEGGPGEESVPLGFSRTAHAIVWDSVIVTAVGEGYRLDLRNGAGRVVAQLSVAVSRRPVTPALRRADISERLKQLAAYRERPRDPAESERLVREVPYADSLPPYSAIFVSSNNVLWVVDPVAPGDTAWSATAFRTDGAILTRLRGSATAPPVAFGDDRVVLRTTDADGVVAFKVHRIVPGRR
jgi:hypothetical protein